MNPNDISNSQSKTVFLPETSYDSLIWWMALILAFFAVWMFARAFFSQEQAFLAKQQIGNKDDKERKTSDPIWKYAKYFVTRYFSPIVVEMKLDHERQQIRRRLIAAGMGDEISPDEFIALKYFLILGFPLAVAGFNYGAEFGLPWVAILATSVLGFFYPDFMLKEKAKERQKSARRAMPFIVDLLALSTEAGLDFIGAIGKVVEKATPSPLVDELGLVLKEMKVGSSRAEALREMAHRLDMSEISSFVSILISADEMGASIGKVLRQQSETIRIQRTVAAEKEGAKAPTKVNLVMFILILPAIMITVLTPFILQTMMNGGI